jgi:hypothetical protein
MQVRQLAALRLAPALRDGVNEPQAIHAHVEPGEAERDCIESGERQITGPDVSIYPFGEWTGNWSQQQPRRETGESIHRSNLHQAGIWWSDWFFSTSLDGHYNVAEAAVSDPGGLLFN